MRWGRILKIAAVVVVVAVAVPVIAVWRYLDTGAATVRIHKVQDAKYNWRPGQPLFILALGSDERAGLFGRRADAIHIIGVNPKLGQGTILNFPRDSWVNIPGHGMGRINEAYHYGGAQLQAETLRQMTGIPIHYVVQTTFDGLTRMVDEIGGVDVDVPIPMGDPNSGAFFPQGRVHMTGAQALAFSRNRHVPDGDLRRSLHQAHLLLSALGQFRAAAPGPLATLKNVGILLRHTRFEGVSATEVYRLARFGLTFDPRAIRNVTIPARIGMMGAMSVVFIPPERAIPLFRDMADDAVLQSH